MKTAATAPGAAIAGTALSAFDHQGLFLGIAASQLLAAAATAPAFSRTARTHDRPDPDAPHAS